MSELTNIAEIPEMEVRAAAIAQRLIGARRARFELGRLYYGNVNNWKNNIHKVYPIATIRHGRCSEVRVSRIMNHDYQMRSGYLA